MICHLVFEHEYIQLFNNFIDSHFDIENHVFIVYDHSSIGYKKEFNLKNSRYLKLCDGRCLAELRSASAIIVHGLFYEQVVDLLVTHKELLSKTAWMLWGGDLYIYRQLGTELLSEELESKRREVISNLRWIVCAVKEDYNLACSIYSSHADYLYGFYSMTIDFDYLDKIRPASCTSGQLKIMVGNSATASNNHEGALSSLSRFSNDDIQVYCPLTYGDTEYANFIVKIGTSLFGNKFHPMYDSIPFNQYANFLASIDIGIMNHDRQQGLGNIFCLLYLGKKVYMRTNISSYSALTNRGVHLFDIEELKIAGFHDVAHLDPKIKQHNIESIRREYSIEACHKALANVFCIINKDREMASQCNFQSPQNHTNCLDLKTIMSFPQIKLYAGDVPELPEYQGWLGLSLTQNDQRHLLQDITKPLPFPDNSVDAFQAEDVLEHIPHDRLVPVINEIFRILKPGALFRLSVPDYGCDVLRERSIKSPDGDIIFDPGGGGTRENPGHVWFPTAESVYRLLEATRFFIDGSMDFLHYWNVGRPGFVTRPIDYSKGFVKRTPDHDERVKNPYRPMSVVVDLYKGV